MLHSRSNSPGVVFLCCYEVHLIRIADLVFIQPYFQVCNTSIQNYEPGEKEIPGNAGANEWSGTKTAGFYRFTNTKGNARTPLSKAFRRLY